VPHSDGLPCDNVNGTTGVMEVEPAVEISATGARQTYQCPGLIATQPIPLQHPSRTCGPTVQASRPQQSLRPRGPNEGKTIYRAMHRRGGRRVGARALIGRRDRARPERLSTANAGDKWAALTGLPMTEARSRMPTTPIRAHSYRRTPALLRHVTRRRASAGERAPA